MWMFGQSAHWNKSNGKNHKINIWKNVWSNMLILPQSHINTVYIQATQFGNIYILLAFFKLAAIIANHNVCQIG